MRVLLFLLLLLVPAKADVVLTVSDNEVKALIELLDIAVRARGLEIAPNALYFMNRLKAAPPAPKPPEREEPK